jgi:two-component system chemotaxis response regulator CheB
MQAIHAAGGITVVQAPQSSEAPTMPAAALARFTPDFVLPAADIAALVASLSPESRPAADAPWSCRGRTDTN